MKLFLFCIYILCIKYLYAESYVDFGVGLLSEGAIAVDSEWRVVKIQARDEWGRKWKWGKLWNDEERQNTIRFIHLLFIQNPTVSFQIQTTLS